MHPERYSLMSDEKNIINNDLHGVLLSAETCIREAGSSFSTFGLILGIAFSVLLSTGFLDEQLQVNLSSYQNWGVYIAIPIIAFFIPTTLKFLMEKNAYLKYRSDISIIAKKSGFNKYKLISLIEGTKKFENISKYLKQDMKIDKEWQ
jgi:hypothetical protein